MTETAVLIVGAGPTGLTLACELARRGVSFRLVEASPRPQLGSRGKGVQPRSLEVLENLGVVDHVLANGWLAMPMHSIAPDGQETLGGAIPESLVDRPDIPYPASLITPQWRVEEGLRLRLAELGGSVEFGTALVSFEQSDDGVTAAIVKDGATENLRAQWLVGCDGGHSIVRKQTDIGFVGEVRDEVRMIIADLELDGLDRDAWYGWQHEEGIVSVCPLPSTDLFQYVARIAPGEVTEVNLEQMQAILERRTGRSDIRLYEPQWSSLWRANVRIADRYREGRVFLAGDAAHIHSPAGGQGMNTGIQDSANLGWKLAAVTNGEASPTLLDTYETERRPVALHVIALSDARLKQVLEQNALPTRRDESTLQLDVGYRSSPLATDDRDDAAPLRAGDRAPDATQLRTAEGEHRLFDLTRGGRFTLLTFGGAHAVENAPFELRTFRVVAQPVGPDEVADAGGHLGSAYGASDRTLVLIRPDGYVALISDAGDVSAVTNYLATIAE